MKTNVSIPNDEAIKHAARLIRNGELVGIPTETVYGLGADALNPYAVKSIFVAKGRPADNPLIVHIAHMTELAQLIAGKPCENAMLLAEAYWPGPITMIFPKSALVPYETTGSLDTVAVRMPAHPIVRKLIEIAQTPIAAPSGNRSGRPSPTTAAHMLEDMDGRIPLILDGGACAVGVESTVVDLTEDTPRILRPGGITKAQIAAVCGECLLDPAVLRPLNSNEAARSPGMKYKHYAPNGQLTIYNGSEENVIKAICEAYDAATIDGKRVLILALNAHLPRYGARECLSLGENASKMAQSLFAALRVADERQADIILSEAVEASGIGLAVMNRLSRAAGFNIINI